MSAKKINQFDFFIQEAKRLRTALTHSEFDFFTHLRNGEDSNVIEGTKYITFIDMIRGTNICDPARYDRFKAAVDAFGPGDVRRIGLDGLSTVLRVPEDVVSRIDPKVSARAGALKEVKEFEKRNHVPVSRQHAETITKKHFVPEKVEEAPPDNTPRTPLEKALDKENRRLRAELKVATRSLTALEAKLQKAEAKLQKVSDRAA